MIYGYIRVSTQKQDIENQRYEILTYANNKRMMVDEWVEDVASGTKSASNRELGRLVEKLGKNDVLIVAEMSRLGRDLMDIMGTLNRLMTKEVKVYTIKEGYSLDDSIQSKVLAFAFTLSAELERTLISQRTKEALNKKKLEGKPLGRPHGSKNKETKLSGKEQEIAELVNKKVPIATIGRILGVNRLTVKRFLENTKS